MGEAIESILAQTFTDFELLILDNASTDNTPDLIAQYAAKDSRIVCYRNDTNLGASKNYNLAVDCARGQYFKWASHDDVLEPRYLECCVEALEKHPDVVLAYPRTIVIDHASVHRLCYLDKRNLMQNDPVVRFRLSLDCRQGECNAVFGLMRTEVLRRTGRIGVYIGSDRVLLAEIALYGKILEHPETLFLRRDHPKTSTRANTTGRKLTKWFSGTPSTLPHFTRWRWALEYAKAALRSPLGLNSRLRSLASVSGWAARNPWILILELLVFIYYDGQPTSIGRLFGLDKLLSLRRSY